MNIWTQMLPTSVNAYFRQLPSAKALGRFGVEWEVHTVARRWPHPVAHIAHTAMPALKDLGVVPELSIFNLEVADPPRNLNGNQLGSSERETTARFRKVNGVLEPMGASVLFAGIPPTLTSADLTRDKLYPGKPRYAKLEAGWRAGLHKMTEAGRTPHWQGYTPDTICVTAACAASQPHLQLPSDPVAAARYWNAIMMVTPVVLSVATNSPIFLGKTGPAKESRNWIWQNLDDVERGRVFFGPGWVNSVTEVFEYYLGLPLFTLDEIPPTDPINALVRHTGSMWPYVRLIPGTQLHVENRALGIEPPVDATATMAFYFGLVAAVAERLCDFAPEDLSFDEVRAAFYAVVENGLDANVKWCRGESMTAGELAALLIPVARKGLLHLGISGDDVTRYLSIIENRVKDRRTGAHWVLEQLAVMGDTDGVLAQITNYLLEWQLSGLPMCQWPQWHHTH